MNDLPVNVAQSISGEGFEFSQDGKWMYSANRVYSVNTTDAANPRIELAHTLPSGSSDVAIHDNRWLILGADAPGELLIWDLSVKPGRRVKTVKFESRERTRGLSLSTDGRTLACKAFGLESPRLGHRLVERR